MRSKPILLQICFALGVLVCLLAGYYISRLRPPGAPPSELVGILKWPFLGVTVILYPVLRRLQRTWAAGREPLSDTRLKTARGVPPPRHLLLFALAEIPALFGLTLASLGAPLRTLLLCAGLSLFYLAVLSLPLPE